MRIYNCDSANVTRTRFDHIRVEESHQLISIWIGKAEWSADTDRGHVNDVTFSDITASGKSLSADLLGLDAQHAIDGVKFDHVILNGQPMQQADVKQNAFVRGVSVTP